MEHKSFPKIARLSRRCIITEKIDGTNAMVHITPDLEVLAGSRNRHITLKNDNYGFAAWVMRNKEELLKLGVGTHYGEWWGQGIQRKYGMKEKVFSLFDVVKWSHESTVPECCRVVPVLFDGMFDSVNIDLCLAELKINGSVAAPSFMDAEGIVIYHTASKTMFKKTIKNDHKPKVEV